ncbi:MULTISPECIES: nuclear transport factor 2 family protein [Novosphingobium]|uniref:nuclear transport factor 2 family protein n=1 Tax=Novosphingobium TaxID=165696 RepID=UPI001CD6F6D4|nr:nuclear transport factor 2 family protein [Novosphingobium percolationis]MCH7628332.1 nuclear transport factor 2 family protein [Pseudomonadota bacterium]
MKLGLGAWHRYMQSGDPALLEELIHPDAVFHSPVVHTPQAGREIVMKYLLAAGEVLGNESFAYVREIVDGENVVLEFVNELDGIKINGIDMIRFDLEGRIIDFKVMVRPLKAINKVWEQMGAQLQKM